MKPFVLVIAAFCIAGCQTPTETLTDYGTPLDKLAKLNEQNLSDAHLQFQSVLDSIADSQSAMLTSSQEQTELIRELHADLIGKIGGIGPVINPPGCTCGDNCKCDKCPDDCTEVSARELPAEDDSDSPPRVALDIPLGREDEADQKPSTDQDIADAMTLARLNRNDVFANPGCGDGRVLIAAIRAGAGKAIGVEIDPVMADRARQRVSEAGLEDRIEVITGDALDFDPVAAGVTCAYVYLWPEQIARLEPVIRKIPRVMTAYWRLPWDDWDARDGHVFAYRDVAMRTEPVTTSWSPAPVLRQPVQAQPVRRQQIVGLPSGSRCQVCGGRCSNPMAYAYCENGRCYQNR